MAESNLHPTGQAPRIDFSRARVLVAGDLMLDRYWFGDVQRISPEAPVPVVRVTRSEERLGGAANVAFNAATLGVRVALVGVELRHRRGDAGAQGDRDARFDRPGAGDAHRDDALGGGLRLDRRRAQE